MKKAFLTNKDSVGGGMTYIRQKMAKCRLDECGIFFADRGQCTARAVNRWGADVVCVNHLRALVQLFRNPFVRPRGRVVFVVHGVHLRKFDFLPGTIGNRLKRNLRLLLERFLYRRCDGITALTEDDAALVRKLYGDDLKVSVEPNSLAHSPLRGLSGLQYGAGEFTFACIARFDFQKGQDLLLRAIASARETLRAQQRRTLFVGGGATLAGAKKFVAETGIGDLVVFHGECADAGAYMLCAKVLVAPSRWEGMPYLLLEARERASAVLASDCAGNRAALAGYARADFFPVGDIGELAGRLTGTLQKNRLDDLAI